ncbi:MAG: pyridoxamine 5'-phosphate oxidase family protein [Ruminococcus sp.]|nr:pyridoxamine 5'-phosphate oxidase family protein [Ruminococcus sp.]
MFREMRRKKQLLCDQECIEILKNGTSGVLALSGDKGYPYTVPISYVYDEGKLYFHSAKSGHKIDAIRNGDKASFCVIERDDVIPEEYTTYFKSVVVFGRIRIIEAEEEKRNSLEKLAVKYYPDDNTKNREQQMNKGWNSLVMLELAVEYMTGKGAIEFLKKH